MPTIQIKSASKISESAKELIKSELGKAIEIIPGKSEQWLMVLFGHTEDLYFRGQKDSEAAIVEVGIRGKASKEDFGALGEEITRILTSNTDLKSDHIYISYTEYDTFTYNGSLL